MAPSFKEKCKVINLKYEYGKFSGKERYAIITDLTEDELNSLFPNEIKRYKPFIILTREMGSVMKEHVFNEKKHAMRYARGDLYLGGDIGRVEDELHDFSVDNEEVYRVLCYEEKPELTADEISRIALKSLTPIQRDYLIRNLVNKESIRAIARNDGKRFETVWDTFTLGKKRYIEAVKLLEAA